MGVNGFSCLLHSIIQAISPPDKGFYFRSYEGKVLLQLLVSGWYELFDALVETFFKMVPELVCVGLFREV